MKQIQTLNLADSARIVVTLDGTVAFKSALDPLARPHLFRPGEGHLEPALARDPIALNDGS